MPSLRVGGGGVAGTPDVPVVVGTPCLVVLLGGNLLAAPNAPALPEMLGPDRLLGLRFHVELLDQPAAHQRRRRQVVCHEPPVLAVFAEYGSAGGLDQGVDLRSAGRRLASEYPRHCGVPERALPVRNKISRGGRSSAGKALCITSCRRRLARAAMFAHRPSLRSWPPGVQSRGAALARPLMRRCLTGRSGVASGRAWSTQPGSRQH